MNVVKIGEKRKKERLLQDLTRKQSLQTATRALEAGDPLLCLGLVDLGPHVLARISSVHFHQLGKIELGLLEDFHFSDEDVLEGEDGLALLLNLRADGLGEGDAVGGVGRREGKGEMSESAGPLRHRSLTGEVPKRNLSLSAVHGK